MKGAPGKPQSWDEYITWRFERHIGKFFEVSDVCVLAFDNYAHVPAAKCMTQAARRKHIPSIQFRSYLPVPVLHGL